jgi:choloylglycine hydrolase
MNRLTPIPVDLWVLPRGIKRDGMTGKITLSWTAKFSSVVAAGSIGMNELAAASDVKGNSCPQWVGACGLQSI